MLETPFNTFTSLAGTLVKGDTSTGVFLLIFPAILKKTLQAAASTEYVIGVADSD